MLTWVAEPTDEQLWKLAASYRAGPKFEWRSMDDIREAVRTEQSRVFEVSGRGCMLVALRDNNGQRRLVLEAAHVRGPFIRGWVADMRRLAAAWSCDAIETIAYNRRLARAMVLSGVEVEAVVLKLEIGRGE